MFCGGVSKISKSPILTSKKSAMGIPNLAPYNDRRSGLHQIYWKTKARAAMEFHPRTKWNFGIKNNWTILFPKIYQYGSQNVMIPDSQNPPAKITILCTKWTKITKTVIFAYFLVFLLKNTSKCKKCLILLYFFQNDSFWIFFCQNVSFWLVLTTFDQNPSEVDQNQSF